MCARAILTNENNIYRMNIQMLVDPSGQKKNLINSFIEIYQMYYDTNYTNFTWFALRTHTHTLHSSPKKKKKLLVSAIFIFKFSSPIFFLFFLYFQFTIFLRDEFIR